MKGIKEIVKILNTFDTLKQTKNSDLIENVVFTTI